jgi:hypothetical protein
MRSKILGAIALVAVLFSTWGVAWAQFGHPLKGQWSGEWGPKEKARRVLLDLQWDGKALTGAVNPGDGNAAIVRNVVIDYSNPSAWKVKIEADGKDPSGKSVKIVADGTLENIGSYYRLFYGTWIEGAEKGDFILTRN